MSDDTDEHSDEHTSEHASEHPGDDARDDESPLTDAELRALRARARDGGDEALRRLVAGYITLRRLSAEMLTLVEAREGAATVVRTPTFLRLRALTRRSDA